MQKKVRVLVKFHETMQEKLNTASYSDPTQIITLVPDKWSRTIQNILISLNTLFELNIKSKKQVKC